MTKSSTTKRNSQRARRSTEEDSLALLLLPRVIEAVRTGKLKVCCADYVSIDKMLREVCPPPKREVDVVWMDDTEFLAPKPGDDDYPDDDYPVAA